VCLASGQLLGSRNAFFFLFGLRNAIRTLTPVSRDGVARLLPGRRAGGAGRGGAAPAVSNGRRSTVSEKQRLAVHVRWFAHGTGHMATPHMDTKCSVISIANRQKALQMLAQSVVLFSPEQKLLDAYVSN
jgi:hypothetical protein